MIITPILTEHCFPFLSIRAAEFLRKYVLDLQSSQLRCFGMRFGAFEFLEDQSCLHRLRAIQRE